MKANTVIKYHFKFEYWTVQSNLDGTNSYVFNEERTGLLISGGMNSIRMICAEPMGTPMQVRNIRDRSGKEIFVLNGVPYPLYVLSAEPQLDPLANVVAWSHKLARDVPREYSDFIANVLSIP